MYPVTSAITKPITTNIVFPDAGGESPAIEPLTADDGVTILTADDGVTELTGA